MGLEDLAAEEWCHTPAALPPAPLQDHQISGPPGEPWALYAELGVQSQCRGLGGGLGPWGPTLAQRDGRGWCQALGSTPGVWGREGTVLGLKA